MVTIEVRRTHWIVLGCMLIPWSGTAFAAVHLPSATPPFFPTLARSDHPLVPPWVKARLDGERDKAELSQVTSRDPLSQKERGIVGSVMKFSLVYKEGGRFTGRFIHILPRWVENNVHSPSLYPFFIFFFAIALVKILAAFSLKIWRFGRREEREVGRGYLHQNFNSVLA